MLIVSLLPAAIVASGCGAILPGAPPWEAGAACAFLRAAEAPQDGGSNELPVRPAPRSEESRPDDTRFGLRFGYMIPSERTEWDFEPGGVLGVYGLVQKGRVAYELGLDVTVASDEDELYDSCLFSGRFDVLFGLTRREARWRGYLHAGLGMMLEIAVELGSGHAYGNSAGALGFGAGAAFVEGMFDLRATCCVLVESQNAKGLTLLVLGVSF